MTASKSLPARPSLESLRKQAKKLGRDIAAGDAEAIARAAVHLPHVELPLTQRNAQLVIAREYGFAGWQDLTAEVSKRIGRGLDWAAAQARRIIHDNDAVRITLDENGNALAAVTEAFTIACGFEHEAVASLLLDRCIALDPELGAHIDGSVGRPVLVTYFIENRPGHATTVGLWKGFVMEQVSRAVRSWSGHNTSVTSPRGDSDLTAFVRLLQREPWLLGEAFVN